MKNEEKKRKEAEDRFELEENEDGTWDVFDNEAGVSETFDTKEEAEAHREDLLEDQERSADPDEEEGEEEED